MLARDTQLTDDDKIVSDNLTHKPSFTDSIYNNFSAGAITAPYAIRSFDQEYNESPRGQRVHAMFESVKKGNENPEVGWVQWGANEVANIAGQALDPATWAFGEVGALAMKPALGLIGKLAPEAVAVAARKPIAELLSEPASKYFPTHLGEETLSSKLFGENLVKGFGVGAGASLPQATIDNFNAETGVHDVLGMAKSLGANGLFGMALSTIPFAWGVARANFNRMRGKPAGASIERAEINEAVEKGQIKKQDADVLTSIDDYKENPKIENKNTVQEKSTDYLAEKGHNVDSVNHTANFEILNKEQMQNLQSATVDQLLADYIPEQHKNALSDFVVHAGIDDMRGKTDVLDGVRGYVDYAEKNLSRSQEILDKADSIIDEHVESDLKDHYSGDENRENLEDLAQVYQPAKTLLDRLHLEDNLNQQKAYLDLAKMMLKIADSNVGKVANVDSVKGYMEARTNRHIEEIKAPEREIEKTYQVPSDSEGIIADQDRMLEKKYVKNSKEEYEIAKDKFNEFKASEGVFKNFINCVLGASNG